MKMKLFFLFFVFLTTLFSQVNLILPSVMTRGEPLTFSLEVTGQNIKLPDMRQFSNMNIQEVSSSISKNYINGRSIEIIKKVYVIFPKESFLFPSLEVEVDGQISKTKEKKIEVIQPSKTKSDLFDFSLKASKNELYLGEKFLLTLVFKYKKDAKIFDLSFGEPNFENFYVEQLKDNKQYEENGFIVQHINFLMTPLKLGELKLDSMVVNAEVMNIDDGFSFSSGVTKNIKIYSNNLGFNVKTLPDNLKLIGDFNVETFIDKQVVKKGEAISYKIKIDGFGNLDDIPDLKLDLKNATIYENKPIINKYLNGDTYYGEYIKTFSIVPNDSFVLEPIVLDYFDKKEQKNISKSSKKYEIKVISEINQTSSKLEKAEPKVVVQKSEIKTIKDEISIFDRFLYFVLGIISSVFILGLYWYVKKQRLIKSSYEKPLIKKVLASKTKDELIKVLSIYVKLDKKLDELIFEVEKVENIKPIKKEIVNLLRELNL